MVSLLFGPLQGIALEEKFQPLQRSFPAKILPKPRCLRPSVQSLESVGWNRMSLASEAKKEKAREAKATRMWADWGEKTQKEISKEAGERDGGGGGVVEGTWTPHPPVNLIPDNDWVGETWGVYFSDYDVDELQERPETYLKSYMPDYKPAELQAKILELAVPLFCPVPRPRTPTPPPPPKEPTPPPPPPPKERTPPPPPPPPKVVRFLPQMRYKTPTPPPPEPVKMGRCTFCAFSGVQEDVIYHLKRSHKAFI